MLSYRGLAMSSKVQDKIRDQLQGRADGFQAEPSYLSRRRTLVGAIDVLVVSRAASCAA